MLIISNFVLTIVFAATAIYAILPKEADPKKRLNRYGVSILASCFAINSFFSALEVEKSYARQKEISYRVKYDSEFDRPANALTKSE